MESEVAPPRGQITIPYAIGDDGKVVRPSDIAVLSDMEIGEYRVEAIKSQRHGNVRFGCPECGSHLYLKRNAKTPHWSHFAEGASPAKWCIYRHSRPIDLKHLEAILYAGRQTGALHEALVTDLLAMLTSDARVKSETISRECHLKPRAVVGFGRYPDLFCETEFGQLAIEVQLSPISLHRLVDRINFYALNGIQLLWVTAMADSAKSMPAWFWDVAAGQGAVAYDLPRETLSTGLFENQFRLRRASGFRSGETLKYSIADLRDCFERQTDFRSIWLTTWRKPDFTKMKHRDLAEKLMIDLKIDPKTLDPWEAADIINWLFSFEANIPVGYNCLKVKGVADAALNSFPGMRCFGLIEKALRRFVPELLDVDPNWLERKRTQKDKWFEQGSNGLKPFGRKGPVEIVRQHLFPSWNLDE